MNVLIIGYGSIGKRHESVLEKFGNINLIDIVTKQYISDKKTYFSLNNIKNLQKYDYFIISSETEKHYEQLVFLEKKLIGKIFFCEKPLFETKKFFSIKKNSLFIGYVLRFNPLLQKLKYELNHEQIINANINCGQYLPTWRPNADYRNSYSAKKSQGGGVLLDLSHEIDYTQWLFGKFISIQSLQVKISDLEIDSDDLTTLIGKTKNGVVVNLSIDYINKIIHRKILVNTIDNSYELDFISNTLKKVDKNGNELIITSNDLVRNDMFESMHKSILSNQDNICTFNEAMDVMDTIYQIQEQNR